MATHRRRLFFALWLALIGAFAALPTDPARAGVIFRYDGACTHTACPDVGLDVGDPVSARIEFADTAIAPNAIVTHADILSFSLDFGTVEMTDASAFGFWFAGGLDATAQGFTEFLLIASDAFETPGVLLFLDVTGWAGGAGACLSEDCFDFLLVNGSFGLDPTIARLIEEPNPTPVPEPSAALLALASIGWLTRRRGPCADSGAPRRT